MSWKSSSSWHVGYDRATIVHTPCSYLLVGAAKWCAISLKPSRAPTLGSPFRISRTSSTCLDPILSWHTAASSTWSNARWQLARCFTQRATSTLGQLHPSDDGKDGGFKSGHYWAKVRDFEKTRPRSDRRAFQQFGLTMLNLFHWIFTPLTSVLSRHMTTILGIHTFYWKAGNQDISNHVF